MKKFVVFLVVVLSIVVVVGIHMRRDAEKRRQAAIAYRQAQARAQAAQIEAERVEKERQAAEKARREEKLREREKKKAAYAQKVKEMQARKEKEQEAAVAKAEDEARAARVATYEKIMTALKGAALRPWRDVTAEDDPARATGDRTFHCLFPDDASGGRMLLELKTAFSRPASLQRLDATTEGEMYEPSEYGQLSSVFPSLHISGDRVYFRQPRTEAEPCSVPEAGQGFNPSARDFGSLYEHVRQLGLRTDAFEYEVFFRPFGTTTDVPVARVEFGKEVPYEDFLAKFTELQRRAASKSRTPVKAAAGPKRTVVFTDKKTVKKRMDGVIEVPRTFVFYGNKHKYRENTLEYEKEIQKEKAAQEKWQKLFDEATRQEELASGKDKEPEKKDATLSDGAVVYRLAAPRAESDAKAVKK